MQTLLPRSFDESFQFLYLIHLGFESKFPIQLILLWRNQKWSLEVIYLMTLHLPIYLSENCSHCTAAPFIELNSDILYNWIKHHLNNDSTKAYQTKIKMYWILQKNFKLRKLSFCWDIRHKTEHRKFQGPWYFEVWVLNRCISKTNLTVQDKTTS